MKFLLSLTCIFLTIYSCITIEGVNSQLDFGDSKEIESSKTQEGTKEAPTVFKNILNGPKKDAPFGNLKLAPQNICLLKADPGFCNLIVGRWYYDHRYHRCLPFLYTGCGGNPNNFMSMKKCEALTHQCHFISAPLDPLTKHALFHNPMSPLGSLAPGFVLAG